MIIIKSTKKKEGTEKIFFVSLAFRTERRWSSGYLTAYKRRLQAILLYIFYKWQKAVSESQKNTNEFAVM